MFSYSRYSFRSLKHSPAGSNGVLVRKKITRAIRKQDDCCKEWLQRALDYAHFHEADGGSKIYTCELLFIT
jgi:hypothetical protein